jgi:ABC-type phosphate transport system permease subunit
MQEQGLFRSSSNNFFHVSTAEKKLFIVFCHYIFLQAVIFVNFSLIGRTVDTLRSELFSYFFCEQNGYNPDNPCSRSGFENLINPGTTFLSIMLAMVTPAVNLVFVVDYRELKQKLRSVCCSKKQTGP